MQSALLFAVTIVTSIGYGHIFPITWQGQIVILCYATIGIPLFLMTTAKISFMLADIFAFLYKYIILFPCNLFVAIRKRSIKRKKQAEKDEYESSRSQPDWDNTIQNKEPKVIDDEDEDEDEDDEEEKNDTKVPLIVILGFYGGFLMLGSYIFHTLEKWNYVAGAYFAYVR